jgi:hypothetical protein
MTDGETDGDDDDEVGKGYDVGDSGRGAAGDGGLFRLRRRCRGVDAESELNRGAGGPVPAAEAHAEPEVRCGELVEP